MFGQGKSAFRPVRRPNQRTPTNGQHSIPVQQRYVLEDDSVFALGENLSRVLMEDEKVAERIHNQDKGHVKRSDTNYLKRFTLFILDTY